MFHCVLISTGTKKFIKKGISNHSWHFSNSSRSTYAFSSGLKFSHLTKLICICGWAVCNLCNRFSHFCAVQTHTNLFFSPLFLLIYGCSVRVFVKRTIQEAPFIRQLFYRALVSSSTVSPSFGLAQKLG